MCVCICQLQVNFPRIGATPAELAYNQAMSRGRITVEWCFGEVIMRFKSIDYDKQLSMGRERRQPLGRRYAMACILQNLRVCLYGSKTSRYFNYKPPSAEEYMQ